MKKVQKKETKNIKKNKNNLKKRTTKSKKQKKTNKLKQFFFKEETYTNKDILYITFSSIDDYEYELLVTV